MHLKLYFVGFFCKDGGGGGGGGVCVGGIDLLDCLAL